MTAQTLCPEMSTGHLKSHLAALEHQNQLLKRMLSLKATDQDADNLKQQYDLQASSTPHIPALSEPAPTRHQAAVILLETAAAQKLLLQKIADRESLHNETPPPLPCFIEERSAAGCSAPPAQLPSAALAVRTRYRSSSFNNLYGASDSFPEPLKPEACHQIPLAQPRYSSGVPPKLPRTSLSPPRRKTTAWPLTDPKKQKSCSDRSRMTVPKDPVSRQDEESLPGSPYWTQEMNIADMPDGETSVYKDAEMRKMLKAWLLPRRTTKWCGGGQCCTLEQKVEQKRSRMTAGRTPMFLMHCG